LPKLKSKTFTPEDAEDTEARQENSLPLINADRPRMQVTGIGDGKAIAKVWWLYPSSHTINGIPNRSID
jgi:hypothetical protein